MDISDFIYRNTSAAPVTMAIYPDRVLNFLLRILYKWFTCACCYLCVDVTYSCYCFLSLDCCFPLRTLGASWLRSGIQTITLCFCGWQWWWSVWWASWALCWRCWTKRRSAPPPPTRWPPYATSWRRFSPQVERAKTAAAGLCSRLGEWKGNYRYISNSNERAAK